jgi:hypothetical protein
VEECDLALISAGLDNSMTALALTGQSPECQPWRIHDIADATLSPVPQGIAEKVLLSGNRGGAADAEQ